MLYDEIVGDAQCRKHPKRCDLSRGIVADNAAHTVTFHLVQPDPNFLYKLALPFAYVLPAGTPHRPARTHGLPATGPYMIATYTPGRLLRLVRNPFFHEWSRAAQPAGYPDRIDLRIAGTANDAIRDVVDGRADVLLAGSAAHGLRRRRGSRSGTRARSTPNRGRTSRRSSSTPASHRSTGSTSAGPLSFAVDRAASTNAWGGPSLAEPTCQILPPNFPGYRPYCPYTAGSTKHGKWSAPDLATARALVARSGLAA